MNIQERTSLMYRIINGWFRCKLNNTIYVFRTPTIDILSSAQDLYNDIIEENKYTNWLSEDNCIKYLIYNGLWHNENDIKIKNIEENIDKLKIDIYKSFFNTRQKLYYKHELYQYNQQLQKYDNIKHSLDYLTLTGFAFIIQQQYILTKTVYCNDILLFDNLDNANFTLLNILYNCLHRHSISSTMYRELARTEPWSSYWRASKDNVFGNFGVLLSSEQRHLILYSLMYDNVYEHPDSPHKDIIDDDDALDGWFLEQKHKRDNEQKNKTVDNITNFNSNAQEVFLPATSIEDIQRIHDLNSLESKIIKLQRKNAIHKMGEIDDAKLPDRQLEIRRLANEKFKG